MNVSKEVEAFWIIFKKFQEMLLLQFACASVIY